MVNQSYQKLKAELESWKESVKIRELAFRRLKKEAEQTERQLAQIKKFRNKAYSDWRKARDNVKRLKTSVSSYPARVRQWTKEHQGEVIDKMFNDNNHIEV